jgi:hypothetical protein
MVKRTHTRKYKGGGYFTDLQYFFPGASTPSAWGSAPSSYPTNSEIRPPLVATFKGGKKRVITRKNRKHKKNTRNNRK